MAGVPYDKRVVDVDLYEDIYAAFHPADKRTRWARALSGDAGLFKRDILAATGRDERDWQRASRFLADAYLITTRGKDGFVKGKWFWCGGSEEQYKAWCRNRREDLYCECERLCKTALNVHLDLAREYMPGLAWYYEIERHHRILARLKRFPPLEWWEYLQKRPQYRVWPFGLDVPRGPQASRFDMLMGD